MAAIHPVAVVPTFAPKSTAIATSYEMSPCVAIAMAIAIVAAEDCITAVSSIAQIAMISPIWIVNNVYYGSIGGVVCELFNMLSVLVSFLRFRKSGYDKS